MTLSTPGLLDDYLDIGGEAASWKKCTGTNEYGQPTFADPVGITLLWFQEQHKILNESGDEISSDSYALLKELVSVGDIITYGAKDHQIVTVTSEPSLVTDEVLRMAYFGTKVGG